MTNFFYKNDLPENIKFSETIAIDTETTGLSLKRDRLCLMQISDCEIDTYSEDKKFFSYRRSTHLGEADCGRNVSVIANFV